MNVQLVARIADTLFVEVGSFTYQNLNYDLTVDASGHVESCTCPDHIYRHRACKHMRALQAELNARKEAEKRAQNERIQAQAQAIVEAHMIELRKQRETARTTGGFCLLK